MNEEKIALQAIYKAAAQQQRLVVGTLDQQRNASNEIRVIHHMAPIQTSRGVRSKAWRRALAVAGAEADTGGFTMSLDATNLYILARMLFGRAAADGFREGLNANTDFDAERVTTVVGE